MERHKRWHTALILCVTFLTLYNIFPTLLYYTKPLDKPIDAKAGRAIAEKALDRVSSLEKESLEWVRSYAKLTQSKVQAATIDPDAPQLIKVAFKDATSANRFKRFLPKAGALIPFYPAQLSLASSKNTADDNVVYVQRKIPLHLSKESAELLIDFTTKFDEAGNPTAYYADIVKDRLLEMGLATGGVSENAHLTKLALSTRGSPQSDEYLHILTQNLLSYQKVFEDNSPAMQRYLRSITQGDFGDQGTTVMELMAALSGLKERIGLEKSELEQERDTLQQRGEYLDHQGQQKLDTLAEKHSRISAAHLLLASHQNVFAGSEKPWSSEAVQAQLNESFSLEVGSRNPLIKQLYVDWSSNAIQVVLHSDIVSLKTSLSGTQLGDELSSLIFNEIARVGRESGEELTPGKHHFSIALDQLEGSQSLLVMNLDRLAKKQADALRSLITSSWQPEHKDLIRENFPVLQMDEFAALPDSERRLSLVIYTPQAEAKSADPGFRNQSIYVIAKDIGQVLRKYENNPKSSGAEEFMRDFNALQALLREDGFTGYPGSQYPFSAQYHDDYIFEAPNYYKTLLQATREDFNVRGTKRFATLELSTLEQQIRRENTIETAIHEDRIKWRDEFNAAQVDPTMRTRFDVPKPTNNVFFSNLALSARKYMRGDENKVLKWGLDLKGGKTVQLELRDNSNRLVTNDSDLTQGINELYNRVNKMGVPDVTIRREGKTITLDFPNAQGLSATELVKASSMSFHVVNEMFSPSNGLLTEAVQRFLQDVWNEAVVTGKTDAENINRIAWAHLYGDAAATSEHAQPRSDAANLLFKHGLRLANPDRDTVSSHFDDSLSRLAVYRGDNYSDWHGQVHPLLIVFNNYALEGSHLSDVRASYDATKGNYLSFSVKGSSGGINPRRQLHTWTSTFSKEKVMGTTLEKYSAGRGWRMAVVLNGFVVSAPTLDSALSDTAMISGHFTQREANRLESDLKAGSLTFTPHILSEKNVSPELGVKERSQGIFATVLALILVIVTMVAYYRFSGVVASVAVLFNLLIIWATLQNIGASITLAGIAGIILTLGMAVDANVLVFERIREEFAACGKISMAISAGYQKAYSAIIDSNLTTILAALILLNFDAGPVKGFALTLIIGIASSMFTALFLTRFFFSIWVQNPKNTVLNMANWIKQGNFNFLNYSRIAFAISTVIVVAGAYCGMAKSHTILGMDFTGGNALTIELKADGQGDYRTRVERALSDAGANLRDVGVRELAPTNHLRLFFGPGMELSGAPFYGMPLESQSSEPVEYGYQKSPRLTWLVSTLQESGLQFEEQALTSLDGNWTSVSGQMSETMRNNAVFGLMIALICILAYITFRFEFKYAISATLGLGFDVVVTLAFLAILHAMGANVQIDLNIVAALMTIVGYSLNDTIIVFDRVREDVQHMRKASFKEVINHALNVTLSRTVMTSVTTLLVLVALVLFGGSTIFGFALFMAIGVVVGTFSSFFIASALLLLFQNREQHANIESKAGNIAR